MLGGLILNKVGDINRAVIIFLGYGSSSFPTANRESLHKHFRTEDVAAIEQELALILKKLDSIEIDWSNQTLESAGLTAKSTLAQFFPFLSNEALEALGWKFTYDWR